MKRILCFALCLMLVLPLVACGQKTQTVEITAENWDTYFEFRTVYTWNENAFGETDSLEYPTVLCVREEYIDRIVMDQVDLAVECTWDENYRYPEIDWENKTMSFGELDKDYGQQSHTGKVSEIRCWESYENAYIVVYPRDIGFSKEMLADCPSQLSMENCDVARIQGTITVKE